MVSSSFLHRLEPLPSPQWRHTHERGPGPINTAISRYSVEYRPSRAKPKTNSAVEGRAGSNIQAALEQGMDPDDVGRLVLDAVKRDTFWILTHPEFAKKRLTRQVDALLGDGSLSAR